MNNWLVRSQYDPPTDARVLWIGRRRYDGGIDWVKPFTMEKRERGAIGPEPTISSLRSEILDGSDFLQACLDHAWEIGLRPAGFNDTTEQVKAIKHHLNDMRSLVFKQKPESIK